MVAVVTRDLPCFPESELGNLNELLSPTLLADWVEVLPTCLRWTLREIESDSPFELAWSVSPVDACGNHETLVGMTPLWSSCVAISCSSVKLKRKVGNFVAAVVRRPLTYCIKVYIELSREPFGKSFCNFVVTLFIC